MSNTVVLTLPADDQALRDKVIAELQPYAEVHETPSAFGLNEIKLVIEIIGGSVGILANAAAITKFILDLKDRREQRREKGRVELARLGEPGVALAEAKAEDVRRIILLDDIRKE